MKHLFIVDIVDDSDIETGTPNGIEWSYQVVADEIQSNLESVYPSATVHVYAGGPKTQASIDAIKRYQSPSTSAPLSPDGRYMEVD